MGIDQSFTGFGIAVWVPDWHKAELDLKAFPAAKHGSGVDRLKDVSGHLVNWALTLQEKNLDVWHICMEGYARNSKYRREEAGELAATVKLTLTAAYYKPVSYPTIVAPKKLKHFVTGSGTASKDDMRAEVFKKWGQVCWDHNIADAYGLARMAEAIHLGSTDPRYPHEAEALADVVPHSDALAA
jgi:Holliday junction resolvasome RuvABC endonuclease subunit